MGVAENRVDMKEGTTAEDDSTQELLDNKSSNNTQMKRSEHCYLDRACLARLVSWVVTEEEDFGSALPVDKNTVPGFDILKSIFLHCFYFFTFFIMYFCLFLVIVFIMFYTIV